jgi:hypothetical protein
LPNTSEIEKFKLVDLQNISDVNSSQPESAHENLKKTIAQTIEEIRDKINNLDLAKLGIKTFTIAFDLEGVLINKDGGNAMPYANEVLDQLHNVLNKDPESKSEILLWTSAAKAYAEDLLRNGTLEVPQEMRRIYREDNIQALDRNNIQHKPKSTGAFQKIRNLFQSEKNQKNIINKQSKIPTLHNVHALIDDQAIHHRNACIQAKHVTAGNFILEGLNFNEEDSLIKALKKLSRHISKISRYF